MRDEISTARSIACQCPERAKEINKRNWIVVDRNCHHSAFNGYRRTPSDYSMVKCLECGKWWRTKGAFVKYLRNGTEDEIQK